jgi:Cu-Zn family superoxide dismutase
LQTEVEEKMFKRIMIITFVVTFVMMFVAIGCIEPEELKVENIPEITKAVATIHPVGDSSVRGVVRFELEEAGIKIIANIEGLETGKHGFHIHQFGDCHAPDAKSAGGHFNPDNNAHGAPVDVNRHVGDLGNLTADENGIAHLETIDPKISFSGNNSIIGRAVIIHANEDDFTSQPTGDAGARVACGVIGVAAYKSENH